MRNRVLIPYIFTIGMLILMILVGGFNVYQLYTSYGWTYQVTTIINSVEIVETKNLTMDVSGLGFIAWITALLIYAIWKEDKKEDQLLR